MSWQELLADRFAVMDTGRVVDLATGDTSTLTTTSAGGPSEQTRWAIRCDALHKLRHRAIAPLVDYGAIGDAQRFEAWRCGSAWGGARAQAEDAAACASAFLRACGLTPGRSTVEAVRSSPVGAVVLLDPDAGYPADVEANADAPSLALDAYGFVVQERRSAQALMEVFDGGGVRPRVVAIWGAPGAGKSTIVAAVARVARLNGFVPVAVSLLGGAAGSALLRGRSLLLIDDERRGDVTGWARLLAASIRSPRPHVLLFAGVDDAAGVDGVALERMPASALIASIRPAACPPKLEARIRRAAEQADGLPGRFVRLLWREAAGRYAPRRRPGTFGRAAEQAVGYGVEEGAAEGGLPTVDTRTWPAPGELAALRRRVDTARQLLRKGRHVPGERALRQAIGALARRGDWSHAGGGSLALAACLVKRGRPRDAQAVLDDAREYCVRGGDEASLSEAATLVGTTWIDLARLDEGESVLGAACAAGRACAAGPPAAAVLGLTRCLFWRGRYGEAQQELSSLPGVAGADMADALAVRAGVLASRIAVGRRDVARAVGCALEAVGRARTSGDAVLVAEATAGAAFAHLAVADLDAVERDVADCLAALRPGRDPLRGIRARLLLAESARRRGRRAAVTALIQRLTTLGGASVPPIVRARCALLTDLVAAAAPERDVVQRHVDATGLAALALFVPLDAHSGRAPTGFEPLIDDVVEILRACQTAEEERVLLADVCGRVRRRLHAAAVAFMTMEGVTLLTIAGEGGRIEPGVAERAISAGIAIPPHRHDDRIEAAVPVKYGGALIGALVARWTLGAADDRSDASAVLTMAAAAAAPAVSAAMTQRFRVNTAGATGLLGASDAMAEVRRAIERAAKAPFPVLIEGESGSGKELIARALHR